MLRFSSGVAMFRRSRGEGLIYDAHDVCVRLINAASIAIAQRCGWDKKTLIAWRSKKETDIETHRGSTRIAIFSDGSTAPKSAIIIPISCVAAQADVFPLIEAG